MVSFYKPAKTTKAKPARKTVTIDRWDMLGQGVCATEQPVLFVDGALPGEKVEVTVSQQQKRLTKGVVKSVVSASEARVKPFCPKANVCGGCQLQHVDADHALTWRQQAITDYWLKQLPVISIPWHAPIVGERHAYRRKARLAVDARNDKQFKLGYRQESGSNVVDVDACPVLQPQLSALIEPLKTLLAAQPARRHIGHVSLLAGDDVAAVSVRLTRKPTANFEQALTEFAIQHQINLAIELDNETRTLHQTAELTCATESGLYLSPTAEDFVQVNAAVNTAMVEQAMTWLAPEAGERIADWFSGLGNFALSMAKRGAEVCAVEGVAQMVQRAKTNALKQGIESVDWAHLDLSDPDVVNKVSRDSFDKVLLDPSREGAQAVCEALAKGTAKSILYVSCNPSTLTRDVKHLLDAGYQMDKVSLIEMFPHTRHLEVMMLLTANKNNV